MWCGGGLLPPGDPGVEGGGECPTVGQEGQLGDTNLRCRRRGTALNDTLTMLLSPVRNALFPDFDFKDVDILSRVISSLF